jgi:probable rRNA maturation factor
MTGNKTKILITSRPGAKYPNPGRIRKRLISILKELDSPEGELSILFTGNAEIKKLNMRYRKKNSATDVLSFPSGTGPGPDTLGDIVISMPVAKAQAKMAGWPLEKELIFLLIHGLLHLLGFDHELGPRQAREMADMQKKLMSAGYPHKMGARIGGEGEGYPL